MKKIYLDNTATTPVSAEVMNEMIPCFVDHYGNSSSLHNIGRDANKLVDNARDTIAGILNVKSNEIYFTASGTEANNWAIIGLANANRNKGNHIITSKIEHHSVLSACEKLEMSGYRVTYLNVDKNGLINIAELMHSITPDTILVSIMAANNEIGTIQNIKTISSIAHEKNIIFHTDAVQLFGHMNIDCQELGIDAMSISAHKIFGPKGAGALYVRNGVLIDNLMVGGNQERNKRGGTLNVPAIVGFGKASEIAYRDLSVNNFKLRKLSDYFVKKVKAEIPDIQINGHQNQKLPQIVSVSFDYVEGESILMMLDLEGICVSTGSACSSNSLEPSHVIMALGVPHEQAQGTIRFSFSIYNTFEEIDYTIQVLKTVIERLRELSPIAKHKRGRKCIAKN